MPTYLDNPRNHFAVARDEAEITNLTNNDIYKFLMMDFILAHPEWANTKVRWKMKVRSNDVKLGQVIPVQALREQLDAAQAIPGVSQADCSFLRGMLGPTGKPLFQENTLQTLGNLKLSEYQLEPDANGGYDLSFEGTWVDSMLWEILALKIVNTLYLYNKIKKEKITNAEFTQIMTQVKQRLFDDIGEIRKHPGMQISEFGTRRSASTDIHRMNYEIMRELAPDNVVGTSNVLIAREFGSNNPKGTNAHELRMIPTALTDDPEEIIRTMYDIDRKWMQHHEGLGILLPDTFGTTFYFQNAVRYGAMDIIEGHAGCRHDSKDPMIGIPEYVNWLRENGRDPKTVMSIPSDGLDAQSAGAIWTAHHDSVGKLSFGIGTNLTNNTKGTWPRVQKPGESPFGSFSVVIKPDAVWRQDLQKWVSCVKLSDNPEKATGATDRVQLFKQIFGADGMATHRVEV